MVTFGLMEFWPGVTLVLLWAIICLASARVHLEVKAAAGSNACWVCFVGRGKPGVGAGICPPLGGSEGVFAWADGTARKTEAATAAASAAATERHRSFRCVLGCSCIFALLAELRPFVEDGRMPSFPETPAAPMTPQASSRTPSCRGDGTSVGPRRWPGRVLTSWTFITVDSAGEDSKPHFRRQNGSYRGRCKRLHKLSARVP